MPVWAAAPTITAVENAAGNLPPGLPGAPIAQGSIFVIYGSGLGPASLFQATPPFQSTSLGNTSVAIQMGATTITPPLYYTSASQVAALLPSNTPVGAGVISVTYFGETSASVPINVVANALGIFTIDSTGEGPAIVTYPDYSLVSPTRPANCGGPNTVCGAANPGDTLILWATGLGPVNGNDVSGAGLGQNMPNIPLTIWLGGVQAPVTYQGRSGCCVGEDQIIFTVPGNVPTGCAVPLMVQTGSTISNSTVMAVASGSRNCTPADAAYAAVNLQQLVNTGPFNMGILDLEQNVSARTDQAQFSFGQVAEYRLGTQPFFISYADAQPAGTCAVYPNEISGGSDIPISIAHPLDAGATFAVKGSAGTVTIPASPNLLQGNATNIGPLGMFLVPGAFTITGNGGGDVGRIGASFNILALPSVTNPVSSATVTRANGLTVTWSGGDPAGSVVILLTGHSGGSGAAFATASCAAPASAGSLTIPAYILESLPADASASFTISSGLRHTVFTATGLDAGVVQTMIQGPAFTIALK